MTKEELKERKAGLCRTRSGIPTNFAGATSAL